MLKKTIVKGTLILTAAGILSRILGFYYRIFLTQYIGTEGLGQYQMLLPLTFVCSALSTSGIGIAICKYTASCKSKSQQVHPLCLGLLFSFLISVILSTTFYFCSDYIALHFIKDAGTGILIKIMCLSFPLSAIHNCLCSFYLGKQSSLIPAFSQLVEQIIRIGSIFFLFQILCSKSIPFSLSSIAMYGLVFGELFACLFMLTCFFLKHSLTFPQKPKTLLKPMMHIAVPITINKLIIGILHSMEAILIPLLLIKNGMSQPESLSTYGIISGLSIPLIMLPSTLINSFAAMLLPAVSEQADTPSISQNSQNASADTLAKTTNEAFFASMYVGIFCLGYFLVWGQNISNVLFHEPQAGIYVAALSWLCPFLYVGTTFTSILNGLGYTTTTLVLSIVSFLIRFTCFYTLIPQSGIYGFFLSLLISQIFLTLASSILLFYRKILHYNLRTHLIIPIAAMLFSTAASISSYIICNKLISGHQFIILLIASLLMLGTYCLLTLPKLRG